MKQVLGDGAGEAEREAFEAWWDVEEDPDAWPKNTGWSSQKLHAYMAWQARAQLAPTTSGWVSVDDRLPECDHEAIFIGINSAGFAGAFNALVERGGTTYCLYGTPEEEHSVMSCLQWWQPMPTAPVFQPQHGEEA